MARRTWRLADALLVLLMVLLPLMLMVGRGEGTIERVTLLFWLLLILPLLILPWLWMAAAPEEGSGGQLAAARRVERETAAAEEFGTLVSPVVQVQRAYVEAGIPIVEGRLRPTTTFLAVPARRVPGPSVWNQAWSSTSPRVGHRSG